MILTPVIWSLFLWLWLLHSTFSLDVLRSNILYNFTKYFSFLGIAYSLYELFMLLFILIACFISVWYRFSYLYAFNNWQCETRYCVASRDSFTQAVQIEYNGNNNNNNERILCGKAVVYIKHTHKQGKTRKKV